MERVPLKQTDRHHKSPGGDLCIRDSRTGGFTMPVSFNKLPANQTTVNRLNCEIFKKKARKSEPGKISVARCTGFEPVTDCLEGNCSVRLS